MNEMNVFLQLFSDEASMPDTSFMQTLEARFVAKAHGKSPVQKIRMSKKLIIIASIVAIIAAIVALVFLPKRDFSDPAQDSLIEAVVESTQENVESFTEGSTVAPADSRTSSSADAAKVTPSSQAADAPVAGLPSAPVILTGFLAEFWNLDVADIAGSPSIPLVAADYSTTSSSISYTWGSASPAGAINPDYFVARFSKSSSELNGQYKVVNSSDNGLRMHVNETVVFDQWNAAGSSGTAYFTTDPAEPVTTITIEYLELDGPASVLITITKL